MCVCIYSLIFIIFFPSGTTHVSASTSKSLTHTHIYSFIYFWKGLSRFSQSECFFLVSTAKTSEDVHPQQLHSSNREETICTKMGDPTWFSTWHYPNKNLLSLTWRIFHWCLIFYICLMLFIHMMFFFTPWNLWNETIRSPFLWNKHFITQSQCCCVHGRSLYGSLKGYRGV